jgi:hypothetical protein
MARRLPPLNALRAFEAAARLGSFSAAAQELRVTGRQPVAPAANFSRPNVRVFTEWILEESRKTV